MKILITGGNGYVGKSIHHSLESRYQITTITRLDFDQSQCEHGWDDSL
jgi:dTDP-4-dehydrorhamnose reductase